MKEKKQEITVVLNNINGFSSKERSLVNIINAKRPNIVCLVETKVTRQKTYNMKGYKDVINKNVKQGKGGMLVAVRSNTVSSVKEVTTGSNQNILTVEVEYGTLVFRLILCYGPQEEDNVEDRKEFYEDLAIEMENCVLNNITPVVLGDLNAKLEQSANGLVATSSNGLLLKSFIEKYDLQVANFHSEAEGHFTRIRKKKGKLEKSLLDYILTTQTFFDSISNFTSDEEKLETPFRLIKRGKAVSTIYSDHCLISASFNLPHKLKKEIPGKRWIITQEGLQKFSELTTPPFFTIDETVGIDVNYNKCTNKLQQTMGKCFR